MAAGAQDSDHFGMSVTISGIVCPMSKLHHPVGPKIMICLDLKRRGALHGQSTWQNIWSSCLQLSKMLFFCGNYRCHNGSYRNLQGPCSWHFTAELQLGLWQIERYDRQSPFSSAISSQCKLLRLDSDRFIEERSESARKREKSSKIRSGQSPEETTRTLCIRWYRSWINTCRGG